MLELADFCRLVQLFETHHILMWVTGGWGIDALLGEQTRPHKDLDVLVLLKDVAQIRRILSRHGFRLKELWEENRWVVDKSGKKTATGFVLQDKAGHEIDLHAMSLDEQGNGLPEWEAEARFILTKQDLSGIGRIGGRDVTCVTAEKQMKLHSGYKIPEKQIKDLEMLHEAFGVPYPIGMKPDDQLKINKGKKNNGR